MNDFYKALNYIKENLYQPNHLLISDVKEEILLKQKILKTKDTKGKMAVRIFC